MGQCRQAAVGSTETVMAGGCSGQCQWRPKESHSVRETELWTSGT